VVVCWASLVRSRPGLPGFLPPCPYRTGPPPPSGFFPSRLSTDRSPSPPLDMTTTVAGSPSVGGTSHPQEWQLASLHGHSLQIVARRKSLHVRNAPKATVGGQSVARRDGPRPDKAITLSSSLTVS